MPHVNPDDSSENSLPVTIERLLEQVATSPVPVVICGVGRKVNIGNFETVDVYAGITIPLTWLPDIASMDIQTAIENGMHLGFSAVSQEATARYNLIKNSQKGK